MKYFPRVIEIPEEGQAQKEIEGIGVREYGVKIMGPKAVFRAVKLKGIRPIAANILKQEMLSRGGEVAVSHKALDLSVKKTDVLIFGTLRQFRELAEKLMKHQFDLPEIAKEIASSLASYDSNPPPIKAGKLKMNFGKRTYIMGILNVTPDSFSDGGKFISADDAVRHALQMEKDGADIIDIGGESTRPGAKGISAREELRRVIPVIKELKRRSRATLSIDTTKSVVAREALKAGASMINDISGLRFDRMIAKVAADFKVPVIIMHMRGRPRTMQVNPSYNDLIGEILEYFAESIRIAAACGVSEDKIIIDPGIGFGKTLEHNLEIIRRLKEFKSLGRPIAIGVSRKSFIGKILDLPTQQRLEGTSASVGAAISNGADIIRVHDSAEMTRVAQVADAITRL